MNNETEQIYLLNPSVNQSSSTQKFIEFELTPANPVNLENVEDFSNVCRTCATITEFVVPIFEGEGIQNNLADKIHKHLPIQVSEQDVLPKVVCYQCASTLLAWHEMVQCCVQADEALRTRLLVLAEKKEKETNPTKDETGQNTGKADSKFKEIADFVAQSMSEIDQTVYINTSTSPNVNMKKCDYCNTEHSEQSFKEHLVSAHSALLFHCDECDTYVDKKEFILHMSIHAVQYASNKTKIDRKKRPKKKKDNNENVQKSSSETQTETKANVNGSTPNEFSDHSDVEYFGVALPESVFEAIEDTEDGPPLEKESNKTKPTSEVSKDKPKRDKKRKSRTCPICSKVYTARSSYFYHIKYSHRATKDFECDICGKKFGTKTSLVQHDAVHTDEHKYSCKDCGKKFRSKPSLYIHEQTHTGIKSFSCTQCGSSFRWRTHLVRHMKRHSLEKAHTCSECGRGFNIHCDLLRHARIHNAGSFECEKCPLKFLQARYLKVHMSKKHSAGAEETQQVSQSAVSN